MTRSELVKGSVTSVAIIAAGLLSQVYVDRQFAAAGVGKTLQSNDRGDASSPSASQGACVDEDGSWKNWSWPNVPILSPKCAPAR